MGGIDRAPSYPFTVWKLGMLGWQDKVAAYDGYTELSWRVRRVCERRGAPDFGSDMSPGDELSPYFAEDDFVGSEPH